MGDQNKNVPRLRFPGYADAWVKCKLGDLGSVSMNRRIFKEETSENFEIPFFKIGTFGSVPDTYITREKFEDYKSKYQYPKIGDVLISAAGSIGKTVVYKGEEAYFQDSNIVWLNHDNRLNKDYLKHFYSIVKWEGLEGNTIQRLYNNNILDTKISLPSIMEQRQISIFLNKFDDLITVNERELNKLKDLKKSYLEKMFPKNGSDIPELRFPGYADAWVKCKLGDVGKTFTGLSGKTKEDFGHGEGKFVTYINVFKNPISDLNELENVEIDDNQAQVNYGDVLFTTSSETPDEVGMSSVWLGKQDNIYLNSFCFGFRPQPVFDYIYLAFMLRSPSIRNHFMLLAQGISRYNISKNKAMEISVPIPELKEQTKIGEFFKHLDNLITVNERELNKLKELKKSYLKDMFV